MESFDDEDYKGLLPPSLNGECSTINIDHIREEDESRPWFSKYLHNKKKQQNAKKNNNNTNSTPHNTLFHMPQEQ